MKRLLYSLFLFATVAFVGCEKNPDPENPENPVANVTVTVQETTPTTVTAMFDKNDLCMSYTFMIAEEGSMIAWMQMYNATLEQCVQEWGLTFTRDSVYTWTELTPNTNYQIYYIVKDSEGTRLDSVATKTTLNGGGGESVIAVSVSDITATTATVTATPNAETALFKDMLIVKDSFDSYGQEAVIEMLKEDPYVHYETDVWTWTLDPSTTYYALAMGQNANGDWGSMTCELFSTLSGSKSKGVVLSKGVMRRKR